LTDGASKAPAFGKPQTDRRGLHYSVLYFKRFLPLLSITALPFDSALFGYPVGRCQLGENWDENLFLAQAKNYQLVYIFSDAAIQTVSPALSLADVRITFGKELTSSNAVDLGIHPYMGELTEQMSKLALESGAFSRFKTDPRFVKGEYEKLYRLWISQALKQGEVLIVEDLAGFVTCHVSAGEASIGLIAVDPDQRGKGWGKRLVKAAENFAYDRGAMRLKIGTQQANAPALAMYQSLGYKEVERCFIYHYWKSHPH
jgi:dTDP-4-amino-4,6-dideoxy-D-galactose acyltransferase